MWYGALLGALIQIAGTLVGKVLISLGIGYVAFKGIDTSIGWAKAQVMTSLGSLGGQAVAVMGMLNIGTAINILVSALIARLTIKGLTGGTLKAMVLK